MLLAQKSYRHLQRQDAPRCCLGQLDSKSAGFGLVPEFWRFESLCVRKKTLKGKKKTPSDAMKFHKCAWTFSVILISPPSASSLWTADRQESTYCTTKKQTIDYIRYISNKNPLGRLGIVAHTYTHKHTLAQETELLPENHRGGMTEL